ncbi:MAG: cytochrome c-type biogenesis protein [Haloarculaceae archaeon]|jgi:cytochrome c-type biogenesis protein
MTSLGLMGWVFSLGVATFFAPCAFPLLPGYIAYFVGQDDGSAPETWLGKLSRAVFVALITSVGFLVVFGALAVVVFALGSQILGNIDILELIAGVVLVVLGVAMATGRSTGMIAHVQLPERRQGPLGFFAFGVVYAAAAAGCTGSLFVGVASLALTGPANALSMFGAYAAGMVVLLVGVTVLSAFGRDTLVRRLSTNSERITRFAGVALVIAGLVQLYYFLVVFNGLAYF